MNKNQRIAMAEKDLQVKNLGVILNKHPNYLTGVFSGKLKARKTREKIAIILEKPVEYLWPEESNQQS